MPLDKNDLILYAVHGLTRCKVFHTLQYILFYNMPKHLSMELFIQFGAKDEIIYIIAFVNFSQAFNLEITPCAARTLKRPKIGRI